MAPYWPVSCANPRDPLLTWSDAVVDRLDFSQISKSVNLLSARVTPYQIISLDSAVSSSRMCTVHTERLLRVESALVSSSPSIRLSSKTQKEKLWTNRLYCSVPPCAHMFTGCNPSEALTDFWLSQNSYVWLLLLNHRRTSHIESIFS